MGSADATEPQRRFSAQPPEFSCRVCPAYQLNICHAVSPNADQADASALAPIKQSARTVPPRQAICHESELFDSVPVICSGWAAAVVVLSLNRRQVLSFLLAGDFVSTTLLFHQRSNYLVETVTDVHYRMFDRAALKSLLWQDSGLIEKFCRHWIEEKLRSDGLIADLGRRTAEERIARLISGLKDRLVARGLIQGGARMPFPLRQHQIADATGLTPVHVNKVLSDFRRRGLIELSDRELTIVDEAGFHRFARAP